MPARPGGGRPCKTDARDVLDAVLDILRAGCQWRYPPIDFPPKSTVWRHFDQWRRDGTLETIHDLLRKEVRAAEKPYHPRNSASVDGQSVDTTSGGEERGRDDAKNVDGRKRHIVVDSMGSPLAVLVTAADVDDAEGAAERFARLEGRPMSQVKKMYADSKYHNFAPYEWVDKNAKWDLEIVRRPKGAEGWVKLPIRWTVERTFAWLGRCRRLSKDREKSVVSSEAFIRLAMIQLMLHRLRPEEADAEFCADAAGQDGRGSVVDRGRIRGGQAGRRAGELRGAELDGLAPAHHPGVAGPCDPGRREEGGRGGAEEKSGEDRELIGLTVPEVRRLLVRLLWSRLPGIESRLGWSEWRRAHQAFARRCHYKKRGAKPPD